MYIEKHHVWLCREQRCSNSPLTLMFANDFNALTIRKVCSIPKNNKLELVLCFSSQCL